MSLKYVLPLMSNSILKSEFNRRYLSNQIGLIGNSTFSPTFFEINENLTFWQKFADVMQYEQSIQLPVFNYSMFKDSFQMEVIGLKCSDIETADVIFKFGQLKFSMKAICEDIHEWGFDKAIIKLYDYDPNSKS